MLVKCVSCDCVITFEVFNDSRSKTGWCRCQHGWNSHKVQETKPRNSTFNQILDEMRAMHDKKNYDYASDANPYSNFEDAARFAGISVDQQFASLCGTKDARTSNLMQGKIPNNESFEDSLLDRAVYTVLWLAWRRDKSKDDGYPQ